ncbi:hypothetical protein BDD12DRAFT_35234 [Trichophaea hybrida]|nr:hypothetical protein BDD12DRAFT_35234 [Trichophaea hybrida]
MPTLQVGLLPTNLTEMPLPGVYKKPPLLLQLWRRPNIITQQHHLIQYVLQAFTNHNAALLTIYPRPFLRCIGSCKSLYHQLSFSVSSAKTSSSQPERRWCPRTTLPVAKTLCESWFGIGNNESRKCERLLEELAAQSCVCEPKSVAFNEEKNHVYCEGTPCWF